MTFDEVKAILEQAKEETLVTIDRSDPMMSMVNINNEGVNHGVMQMYYTILTALYALETEKIRDEIGKKIREDVSA